MKEDCPKHVELILEINKTVIVASRWFLYYLTYMDDARSNTNQVYKKYVYVSEVAETFDYLKANFIPHSEQNKE